MNHVKAHSAWRNSALTKGYHYPIIIIYYLITGYKRIKRLTAIVSIEKCVLGSSDNDHGSEQ